MIDSKKLMSLEEIFAWTHRKFKQVLSTKIYLIWKKMIRVSMDMCHRVPNIDINECCGDNISHEYRSIN